MGPLLGRERARPSKPEGLQKTSPLREETVERRMASVLARCQKMLDKQTAVYEGTRELHKAVEGTPNKRPRPRDKWASRKLSDDQRSIIAGATDALAMVKAEGSAAAFSEFFEELRGDMKRVRRRLESGDVSPATQALELDIIDMLKEMILSLKKC
jgi:hypothetical protein